MSRWAKLGRRIAEVQDAERRVARAREPQDDRSSLLPGCQSIKLQVCALLQPSLKQDISVPN